MDNHVLHDVTESHLAFQVALDLKDFDDLSLTAEQEYRAWCARCSRKSRNDLHVAVERSLIPRGLVERDHGRVQVTPGGRAWARVIQLSAKGTFTLFGHELGEDAWSAFWDALDSFIEELRKMKKSLTEHFSGDHTTPDRLETLIGVTSTLRSVPELPERLWTFEELQEAAVLACRCELLLLRNRQDRLELRARDRQVLDGTKLKLTHLSEILASPALASALSASKPRITDFVNVGVIEASRGRLADEKFGILAAPALFLTDFAEASEGAFSRDRSFAVAFIDIDNFKAFNAEYLETNVDQNVLPYFMRAIEAYCYGRAVAYRQGGDEYLVLLRNADMQEAQLFFRGLQAHIAQTKYPDNIVRKPTVSIGVHVIDGNHEVTVLEAKKIANETKDKAKKAGRNCVCFSSDP